MISEAEFSALRDRMVANAESGRSDVRVELERTADRRVETPAPAKPRRGRLNKLEARFQREFLQRKRDKGDLLWYDFEALKFRLADGAWYTPDFVSEDMHGSMVAWETKGFWREAARIRIKVAADKYPWIRFIAVTRDRRTGEWVFEHFQGRERS